MKGFPFGGLLAAMCAGPCREGLGLTAALRSLSVQYLSAATFDEQVAFRPRLLRGGRNVVYAAVEAEQARADDPSRHRDVWPGRLDASGVAASQSAPAAGQPEPQATIHGPMAPHFSRHVDYRFDGGPNILGGNAGRAAVERIWMRMSDRRALDEVGLCYLLDALYPPAWTLSKTPAPMTTVDLRIDVLNDPTPDNAPDGGPSSSSGCWT